MVQPGCGAGGCYWLAGQLRARFPSLQETLRASEVCLWWRRRRGHSNPRFLPTASREKKKITPYTPVERSVRLFFLPHRGFQALSSVHGPCLETQVHFPPTSTVDRGKLCGCQGFRGSIWVGRPGAIIVHPFFSSLSCTEPGALPGFPQTWYQSGSKSISAHQTSFWEVTWFPLLPLGLALNSGSQMSEGSAHFYLPRRGDLWLR